MLSFSMKESSKLPLKNCCFGRPVPLRQCSSKKKKKICIYIYINEFSWMSKEGQLSFKLTLRDNFET